MDSPILSGVPRTRGAFLLARLKIINFNYLAQKLKKFSSELDITKCYFCIRHGKVWSLSGILPFHREKTVKV